MTGHFTSYENRTTLELATVGLLGRGGSPRRRLQRRRRRPWSERPRWCAWYARRTPPSARSSARSACGELTSQRPRAYKPPRAAASFFFPGLPRYPLSGAARTGVGLLHEFRRSPRQ